VEDKDVDTANENGILKQSIHRIHTACKTEIAFLD